MLPLLHDGIPCDFNRMPDGNGCEERDLIRRHRTTISDCGWYYKRLVLKRTVIDGLSALPSLVFLFLLVVFDPSSIAHRFSVRFETWDPTDLR